MIVSGHLDSWDVGTGAQDDGAGVAIVIEAARRVGELAERPRRTLRVALFANEEFGLSGARQYTLQHASVMPRHHAAIEADSRRACERVPAGRLGVLAGSRRV